jgi:hypothetical protein
MKYQEDMGLYQAEQGMPTQITLIRKELDKAQSKLTLQRKSDHEN